MADFNSGEKSVSMVFEDGQGQGTNAVVRTHRLVLAGGPVTVNDFYARFVLADLDHFRGLPDHAPSFFLKAMGIWSMPPTG